MQRTIALALTALLAALLAACASQSPAPPAVAQPGAQAPSGQAPLAQGEPFTLPLGGTATFADSGLTVRFVEVLEDSRCPANARCIKMGLAVIALSIVEGEGDPVEAKLSIEGATFDGGRGVQVGQHTLRLVALEPYPGMGPGDYVATLLVTPAGQ